MLNERFKMRQMEDLRYIEIHHNESVRPNALDTYESRRPDSREEKSTMTEVQSQMHPRRMS